ncbi:MAG: hypothetical protein OHK0022_09970 [Roseiflexaceae bacterium]
MHQGAQRRRGWLAVAGSLVLLVAGCALLAAFAWPVSPEQQRDTARQLWDTRTFSHYRILVQVERADTLCLQELEIRDERSTSTIRDTCGSSWFSQLSVSRLFEFTSRIEQTPSCYPSSQLCTCQQLRVGQVHYDPQLGYPILIDYDRRIRPNPISPDFWRRALESRRPPSCEPASRIVRITVLSLVPIQ